MLLRRHHGPTRLVSRHRPSSRPRGRAAVSYVDAKLRRRTPPRGTAASVQDGSATPRPREPGRCGGGAERRVHSGGSVLDIERGGTAGNYVVFAPPSNGGRPGRGQTSHTPAPARKTASNLGASFVRVEGFEITQRLARQASVHRRARATSRSSAITSTIIGRTARPAGSLSAMTS